MIQLRRSRKKEQPVKVEPKVKIEVQAPVKTPEVVKVPKFDIAPLDALNLREKSLFIGDEEVIGAPRIIHHTDTECPMVVDFPTAQATYRVVLFGEDVQSYGKQHKSVMKLWDLLHKASHAEGQTHRFSPKQKLSPLERLVRYASFFELVKAINVETEDTYHVAELMAFVAYTMQSTVKAIDQVFCSRHACSIVTFGKRVFSVDSLQWNGRDVLINGQRVLYFEPILTTQYSRLYMPSLWEGKTVEGHAFALFTLTPGEYHQIQPWLPKRAPLLTFDRVAAWWTSGANILSMDRILTGEYAVLRPVDEALDQKKLQALSAWHQNVLCHYAHMVRLRFETENTDA